jgi:ATP-binding cassette subfamily E protein 1
LYHDLFQKEVLGPLEVAHLFDRKVKQLSGGELQRVAIVLALGTPCDVYLLDEPSAFLDCEQRIRTAQVIKRFILQSQKTAFVVEHDFIMLNYLGDRIIVFEGTPGIACTAQTPTALSIGVSAFLKSVNVTIRRDPTNFRPRINKLGSVKDQTQKREGIYFDTRVEEAEEEKEGETD